MLIFKALYLYQFYIYRIDILYIYLLILHLYRDTTLLWKNLEFYLIFSGFWAVAAGTPCHYSRGRGGLGYLYERR